MYKPFVISEDAELLLRPWAQEHGFILPSSAFFAGLLDEIVGRLRKIFGEVVLAEEFPIGQVLQVWTLPRRTQTVSMDGVYFRSVYSIQVNRGVDEQGNDVGLRPRPGARSLREQIQAIHANGLIATEIVLVDDVVFSGHQAAEVIDEFARVGVSVRQVLAGISVGAGEKLLAAKGVDIRSIYSYPEVVDEVCQRDFLPGIPRSGRYLAGSDNIGLPYLLPFGNPGKWASIPAEHQLPFSKFCIERTIWLFEAIEHASGKVVDCSQLGRRPIGVPATGRYVEVLKKILNEL